PDSFAEAAAPAVSDAPAPDSADGVFLQLTDDVELLPGDDEPEASAHAEAIEVVEAAPMPETAQEMPLATPLDAPMEAPVDVPTDTPIEVPAAVQTAWGVLPSEPVAPVEAVSRGRQDID